ncbi:hypothetical protein MLD38_019052 [Melastoma candidum]|uniref:Uncharacterized protein n=1 Tax=Melastoma candidum TaxID=119954 RepID=A0ACB9QV66_9MYRT|nr:hypothetical protein MLD38_019052 [Melastoma candidum]
MAGGLKTRKRVEAADSSAAVASLLRARDGSAFARCNECKKNVPVALIGMHSCSLDAQIKMNLESQVVEMPAEAKKKSSEKRKTAMEPKAKKAKTEKKTKKGNGSNLPKRPPTAFFIFMNDFRKEFKEENPNSKDVKEVAKRGGEKWKSMTDEEKKPYMDKAAELKAEHAKSVEDGNDDNANEVEEKDKAAVENVIEELTDEE